MCCPVGLCAHVPSWVRSGTVVRPVGLIHWWCQPVGYGIYVSDIYSAHAAQLGMV